MRGHFLLIILFGVISFATAWGQDLGSEQREQIESRQEEQLEKLREKLTTPSETLGGNLRPKPEAIQQKKDAITLPIRVVVIQGSTRLPSEFVNQVIQKYQGKKLGMSNVQNLLRELTNEYIKLGYTTTRPYLPPQDLRTGKLIVKVVEGRTEQVAFAPKSVQNFQLGNVFPHTKGKILNIRDFEQGIDQINRLKSNDAKLDFLPGANPGTSRVIVMNKPSKQWHLYHELNNYGLEAVGEWQSFNTLAIDNILGVSDLFTLSYGLDVTGSSDGHFNDLMAGQFSIPYGYWLFSAGYSRTQYQNDTIINHLDIRSRGETDTYFLNAQYVVYRDQKTKVTASTSINHRDSENYINDILLRTASRHLSSASLGVSYERSLFEGTATLQASLGYERGVDWFDAKDDDERLFGEPYAQYDLFTLSAAYAQKFKLQSFEPQYSVYFNGQYAPREVFASEGINLGSDSTVRGFRDQSVVGSSGIFLRQELSVPFAELRQLKLPLEGKLAAYLHYDVGTLFGSHVESSNKGALQGAGIGLRLLDGPVGFETSLSVPLSQPDSITENDPIWGMSMSLKF